jgi:diguanylate cyclase (GGDEF)-like protein
MLNVYPSNIRALTFAIFVFVLLDVTILGLNMWLATRIDEQALAINLAGRQRMLSQRLTKALLLHAEAEIPDVRLLKEMSRARRLFDRTLQAFTYGGQTSSPAGKEVSLQAIEDPGGRKILQQTAQLWAPLAESVKNLIAADNSNRIEALEIARTEALAKNEQILELMNAFTVSLEDQMRIETDNIRLFQLITVLLAVINFIIIVRQFMGHIEMSNVGQEYLSGLINKINASVLVSGQDGQIRNCNLQSVNMFGYHPDEMTTKKLEDLVSEKEGELLGRKADGTAFMLDLKQDYIQYEGETVVISTLRDITLQRSNEKSLHQLAYHDPLTNLPNRLLVMESLSQDVARSHRYEQRLGVCFIDLDGFKQVNDTYGHDVGDELLFEVARKLRNCARESDTIGRLGGDEFVIVFSDVGSAEDAGRLAKNIVEAIETITSIRNHDIEIGASVGISIYPEHSQNPEMLLKYADHAMYDAKGSGKGKWKFHTEDSIMTN